MLLASAYRPIASVSVPRRVAFLRSKPCNSRLGRSRMLVFGSSKQSINAAVAQDTQWDEVAKELENESPLMIALKTFGSDVAIAFSGAEDVALVEYAHLTGRPFRVFSLDTGRLNPETYKLFDDVEKHYQIRIEYTFPDAKETMDLVREKGMFSFYEDGHQECCRVRKVRPLRRQLSGLKAWITGQRKDQSPGTRTEVPAVQVDPVFEGISGGPGSLVKYNPLTSISSEQVWNFLRVMAVPVNALHSQGYVSIGCEPCTRPVLPNQHEREGRWWWEDSTGKECGLHSGNIKAIGEQVGDSSGETLRDLWTEGNVKAFSKEEVYEATQGKSSQNMIVCLYAPWCPYSQAMEGSYSELADRLKDSTTVVAKHQADLDKEFSSSKLGLTTFPTVIFIRAHTEGYIFYPSERRGVDTLEMWTKTIGGNK